MHRPCPETGINDPTLSLGNDLIPEVGNHVTLRPGNHVTLTMGNQLDLKPSTVGNIPGLRHLYENHPDPNYDPASDGIMAWDLYREMRGSHGEFVIDGNMTSVEYTDRLSSIKIPTLITVGDHDECDPSLSQEMHEKIAGSILVILPRSGHMTFVDQPTPFLSAVDEFLHPVK